jgi:hypothetical protein
MTLPDERLMLRSRRADFAEQEVFSRLLAHFALCCLMVPTGATMGDNPGELSFLATVRVVCRHLPLHAALLLALPFGSPSSAPEHADCRAGREPRGACRAEPP